MTPQQLVNNVLIGGGVTASNIQYTGSANAIGHFDGINCNVGLDSGIILTTGTILDVPAGQGPQGPNDLTGAGVDNNEPGEPLLAAAAGNPSFNAAKLEFDFVPQSDTIKFNYVFASEEYLEFVGGTVNDAFGFFISGPNPAGGNYTNQNIALIPGTTTTIDINNVNATSNSAYYVDNGDGNTAPQNGSNQYIQYDGRTTVLEARAVVTCGETYHIVIAISDIGDGILDSGVFLEAASFSSPGIEISSDLSFQGTAGNDSTLFEGCTDATLWFVRTDSIPFSQTVPLGISGTATNGTDYTGIPNAITFPPGQDSVSITMSALFDGIAEGLETIQVNISVPTNCAFNIEDSIIIYIQDVDSLQVGLPQQTTQCPNSNVTLTPTVTGGNANYDYLWNTGETTQTIQVNPSTTTSYHVTVTDTCGQVASDTTLVTVQTVTPVQVTIDNDTLVHCPNLPIDLDAIATNGYGGNTFVWSTGATTQQVTVQPATTTIYSVTVTDQCGFTATDSATVTIQEIPLFVDAGRDQTICKGDTVNLHAVASGGFGTNYSYKWSTNEVTQGITVQPNTTTEYIVQAADECGEYKASDTVVVHVNIVQAAFVASGVLEENLPIHFTNLSVGATSYFWDFGNSETSTETHPSTIYDSDGGYLVMLVAVNDTNGCVDTLIQGLNINPEFFFYAPNTFTPDGDEFNQNFFGVGTGIASYRMQIFDRWGELIFETNDAQEYWDGTYKGRIASTGTYVYKFRIKNLRDEVKEYVGHVQLLR